MMPGLMRQREGQSFDTDLSVSPEPTVQANAAPVATEKC